MQGEAGGRKAAERLSSGIMEYIRTSTHHIPTGIKIWTVVFLSKAGLEQTLNRFVSLFMLLGLSLIPPLGYLPNGNVPIIPQLV